MSKKNWRIFYPLLLGIYPALGLVSVNISQMVFSEGLRSILVAALFSFAVYWVFCWRIMDEYKAALLCAWFILFFFAYGHVFGAVEGVKIFGVVVGRHRFIFPLWLVVFGAGGWWIYKRSRRLESLSWILNTVSIVLLVIPVIQIGVFEWHRHRSITGTEREVKTLVTAGTTSLPKDQLPDVYYIILDGYPRQDALLEYHHFDNSEFIKQLEAIGFYVPSCSQSNYAMTDLSLTSSLNMNYLEGLNPNIHAIDLNQSIIHSKVRQFLKGLGYYIVSFDSGIWFTELQDADYYINKSQPVVSSFFDFTHLSEFEILFVRTTVLRLAEEFNAAWLDTLFQNPRKESYERILFEFDQLDSSPSLPGPKFVFVHIVAPHSSPYIFNADGSFVVSGPADPALGNELQFLNERTLEAVRAIIAKSKNPPIIVIQGDHGLDTEVRMANLIAYYFPNGGAKVLYPTITPVNSFRLVFDTYFGQRFPLLPDVSYYSPYQDMFAFTKVHYPCLIK
ncbi:MAG: hypothetical protein ABSF99_02415 [Anaerolineales bacterium]|jgi:hypothetical protein